MSAQEDLGRPIQLAKRRSPLRRPDIDTQQIVRMYVDLGLSSVSISRELDCTKRLVLKRLVAEGVARRSPGAHPRSLRAFAAWFWSRVDQTGGPDACWPYLGWKLPAGYGQISARCIRNGRLTDTQDVAFFLVNGHLPKHQGNHSCDNPPCCNPKHIWDGTNSANALDAISKGRPWGRHKKARTEMGDFDRAIQLCI